jgi:hypothetical protein
MEKEITVDVIKDRMKDKLLSYMMPKVKFKFLLHLLIVTYLFHFVF